MDNYYSKYIKYKKKYLYLKINIRKSNLRYKTEFVGGGNFSERTSMTWQTESEKELNFISNEEELNFISKKCTKQNIQKCTKQNIQKVLDFYYEKLARTKPNPELSYDIMAQETELPLKLIKLIWKYQLEFLIEKGIANVPNGVNK